MSFKLASGKTIPSIGFGVYLVPAAEAKAATFSALTVGYRLIDSAIAYGNEKEVGEGIAEFLEKNPSVKRSDIFYTTKIAAAEDAEDAARQIQESFEKVKQLEYIDLFLIHSPFTKGPQLRQAVYNELLKAQKKGLTKEVGVSNYGVKHLQEFIDNDIPLPSVNQVELNPWLQRKDIVDFSRKHNILVEAYSPLTRGIRLEDPELVRLAAKYNKTKAQILLRWSLQAGFLPLPKSTSTERQKENLDVYDFKLSSEDFAALGDPEAYYVTAAAWDPTKWD